VYERLIGICLRRRDRRSQEDVFGYMEQAKSRSLLQLMLGSTPAAIAAVRATSALAARIESLREELSWDYRRMEQERFSKQEISVERLEQLQTGARAREKDFQRLLRELPCSELEEAGLGGALSLEKIRSALDPATALVEYF